MTDETFTEPENKPDEWADVRMTDPEKGEWDVDFVVEGGQVKYMDLRVRPELLTAFVDCLLNDITDEQIRTFLTNMAADRNIDLKELTADR